MGFLPAYAVDGGTLPAQMLRLVAWVATSGATGIATPTDLRVTPTAVPSGAVVIMPGGAVIATRYPGGSAQQSYAVANTAADGDALVNVPPQGSSGPRTDYLIYRIDDPQYGGQVPDEPLTAIYGRPELVSTLDGITYPYLPLASITIPANTATITAEMITDLREMANPRQLVVTMADPTVMGSSGMDLNSTQAHPDGEWFPNHGGPNDTGWWPLDIPEWATRMMIRVEWLAVNYPPGSGRGRYWATWGPGAGTPDPNHWTQAFRWDADTSASRYNTNWILAQEVPIPAELRGTSTILVPRANYTTVGSNKVGLTAESGMVVTITYKEAASF